MDVFDLDRTLVADYERFARSFTRIRAEDIRTEINRIYASRRFWPEALISLNPRYDQGGDMAGRVADGTLHPDAGRVFRIDGQPINLYRHQAQAIAKSTSHQSFIVTTGTGSGKSLCFFIPIIDATIRARTAKEPPRTRAIVIYPMNALANSQAKELEKYIEQAGLPEPLRPTFARYTGQETEDEKEQVARSKPDILLTNFMMLELLMTRQDVRDRTVIGNAEGLDFLVLDELHTYRGRQGADVAMLVRRVRDRLCHGRQPVCIGTSATMASEGGGDERALAVAAVASRLFGTPIGPDSVIDESLTRATDPALKPGALGQALAAAIDAAPPSILDDKALKSHPLAVWIELEVGLVDGQRLARRPPVTIRDAADRLAKVTGREPERCRLHLEAMLTLMTRPNAERGGSGEQPFLAFKLHRFLSGAGHVYATLRRPGERRVTLDGQIFDPAEPTARLYQTFFCRSCGQEFHPVTIVDEAGTLRALQRPIDETPLETDDAELSAGYLMPEPDDDADFRFRGLPEDFPEEWIEPGPGGTRLRAERRKFAPREMIVDPQGAVGATGRRCWFLPGRLRFCPACGEQPAQQAREINKLAGLSAEGRSSATTLLVASTLHWMNQAGSGLPAEKRKLLGFTDNRQDAALQAGHFNDFLFVSLLRGAILAAVRKSGTEGLAEDSFGRAVQAALGFTAENQSRRQEWMLDPEAKGAARLEAERVLSRVLGFRIWVDQRRGWRFTNPNLEELRLIEARYVGLDDLVADDAPFAAGPPELLRLTTEQRREVLLILLEGLRRGLAVTTEALDAAIIETTASASRQALREPWAISQQEQEQRVACALLLSPPNKKGTGRRGESLILRGGATSALGRRLNRIRIWGHRLPSQAYREILEALLRALAEYQLVRQVATSFDLPGWQLAANAVRLIAGPGGAGGQAANPYFVGLYESLAGRLASGGDGLLGLEGREHTAQVDQERREWREWRFRFEEEDRKKLAQEKDKLREVGEPQQFLPALFCSPTMELGVDISALNAVYLRNIPPTPANYAQRSGRAGRSGQAALIVAYCAAQSPHDQYYFGRPDAMVRGVVRPPALELANRDLIAAHLHAVWLARSGQDLPADIPHVLDLHQPTLPVRDDIAAALADPELKARAGAAMRRVLAGIEEHLTPEKAPWAADRDAFVATIVDAAPERFSRAFERWRQLYQSAHAELAEANRKTETRNLGPKERKEAQQQQRQANEQIALLERGRATGGSDFYTYRYLATEGFLPGYNFPRLPLYAYVPAAGTGGAKAAYLQRARFLAIAEFGPHSLIYHEGRAYRVIKAKLPPGVRAENGGLLATGTLFVCAECGAAHNEETERCHACRAGMAGVHPIRNTLHVYSVETWPAERITANDEDRQRQGFEIQTVFAWPRRDRAEGVTAATAADQEGPILKLDYAAGATISRVNKGLRRRRDKTRLGFGIDPVTGRWARDAASEDGNGEPDKPARQTVVPIVEDSKNAMLLRLAEGSLGEVAITTLEHALARGIATTFELEEGETSTEPLPSAESRNAILVYEATEGGAGVLGRLVGESDALRRVAKEALRLIHCDNVDAAVAAGDPAKLRDDPNAACVKGCYRCLLSYYNQPDHELIDRRDPEFRRLLFRIACSTVKPAERARSPGNGSWREALEAWKLPPPDAAPLDLEGVTFPLAWRAHLVAATPLALPPEERASIERLGYAVVALPEQPGTAPPPELLSLLGGTATGDTA